MSQRVDARGLSCPMPVVLVKKALDGGASQLEVLLDSPVACENVSRLLSSRGFSVTTDNRGDHVVLLAKKG